MALPRFTRHAVAGLAALLIASACVVVVTTTTSPAYAATCDKGIVALGARGSDEKESDGYGLGPEVLAAYTSLQTEIRNRGVTGKTSFDYVHYPASGVGTLANGAPGVKQYFEGLAAGVKDARTRLQTIVDSLSADCPGPRVVLFGYSQGAMVMHRLLQQLSPGGSNPDSNLLARIGGAILLADGDKFPGSAGNDYPGPGWTAGTFGVGASYPSLSGSSRTPIAPSVRDRTYNVCINYDIVCDPPQLSLTDVFNLFDVYRRTQRAIRVAAGVAVHVNAYKAPLGSVSGEYGATASLATKLAPLIKAAVPPTSTLPTTTPPTTTPPTTTPPSTTTPPGTYTPPMECKQPAGPQPKLVYPAGRFGEFYSQQWEAPAIADGCTSVTLDSGSGALAGYQMTVGPGNLVQGTPTANHYPLSVYVNSFTDRTGPVEWRVRGPVGGYTIFGCWGAVEDNGYYKCLG